MQTASTTKTNRNYQLHTCSFEPFKKALQPAAASLEISSNASTSKWLQSEQRKGTNTSGRKITFQHSVEREILQTQSIHFKTSYTVITKAARKRPHTNTCNQWIETGNQLATVPLARKTWWEKNKLTINYSIAVRCAAKSKYWNFLTR
jgi:hypothetical protein